MMPKKRQALVEYEDMNGSCNAVTYAAENQVYIGGHPAFINYSTSQKISRPGDSDDTRSVNNVLLLTIINPIYPITTVTWIYINKPCVQWQYFVITDEVLAWFKILYGHRVWYCFHFTLVLVNVLFSKQSIFTVLWKSI